MAHPHQPGRHGGLALSPGRDRPMRIPLGQRPFLHRLRRPRGAIVRLLLRSYDVVRLLSTVRGNFAVLPFAARSGDATPEDAEISQVPSKELLPVHGVFDCARHHERSPCTRPRLLSSASLNSIDTSVLLCFRSSIPSPRSPLSTLHVSPRDGTRMTRGRGGWRVLTPRGTFTHYSLPAFLAY